MSWRRLGTILAHELRLIARDPLPVMVLIVFPIITIAFVKPAFAAALQQTGYPHANGAEQVVPGQAVMNAFFIVSLTTFAFFSEYAYKTWDRVRSSPATSPEIVLGKAIPRVAMVILQLVLVLTVGVALFGLHIAGNPLALLPLSWCSRSPWCCSPWPSSACAAPCSRRTHSLTADSCCSVRSAAHWFR